MKKRNYFAVMAVTMAAVLTACGDDEPNGGTSGDGEQNPSEVSFVVTSGDPENDLGGGVALRIFSDLETPKADESVYFDEDGNSVKVPDTFTQVSYNSTTGMFTGFIYARGASAEGIGSLKAGLRSYKIENGRLVEVGSPVIVANFGNTGTYGNYSYAAQISNPYVMRVAADGSGQDIAVELPSYAIDGTVPTVSNIVDMGNNRLAMVLSYANTDVAAVAFTDYDLNITSVKTDERIGTSMGAMRSVRYSLSGADDEGNVYLFAGNSADDSKVGAIRILKDESDFDPDYSFNILEKSDGYRFRKAFHISGDYFLLDFFTDKDSYENMSPSGKLAVVNVKEKTLVWVNGLPEPSTVSIGWGDGYQGKYYLPIAAPTEMSGGSGGGNGGGRNVASRASSVVPTIYAIDAVSGRATSFMTFKSNELLKAVTIIK